MSSPLPNIADRMMQNDINSRMFRAERDRVDTARREKVNKEYEKALSSSSESESGCKCQCKCKAEKLTPEEIAYRRDLDRRLAKWDSERLKRHEEFRRKLREDSICTIL